MIAAGVEASSSSPPHRRAALQLSNAPIKLQLGVR